MITGTIWEVHYEINGVYWILNHQKIVKDIKMKEGWKKNENIQRRKGSRSNGGKEKEMMEGW